MALTMKLFLLSALAMFAVKTADAQIPIPLPLKDCRASVPAFNCGDYCMAFFMGCYHSTAVSVLPGSTIHDLRAFINLKQWAIDGNAGSLIEKCAKIAAMHKADYIGIENYGDCRYGNTDVRPTATKVTNHDGCDSKCPFDVGANGGIVVYHVLTWPSS